MVSGGAVAYVAPISATHGFAFMRNSDMYAAYDVLMDKIAQGAIEAMGKEGFKNAVVSPASAAPAPPPEGEAAPAPSPETPAAPTVAPQPTT